MIIKSHANRGSLSQFSVADMVILCQALTIVKEGQTTIPLVLKCTLGVGLGEIPSG